MTNPLMISFEAIRTQREPNPEYLPIPKCDWMLFAEDETNYLFKRTPFVGGYPQKHEEKTV